MTRSAFQLLFLLLWSLSAQAEIGRPFVDEFRRTDLGAQGLGWSATQLRDGRLVFGFDGISIFDGMRWTTEPGPRTYAIRALDAAEDGGFWVGGVNEVGYFTVAGGGFLYHSLTEFLPPGVGTNLGDVWNVFADGPGQAVFVTGNHILQWRGDHFVVEALRGAPRLAGFRRGAHIFVGHRPTGLRAIRAHGLETVLSTEQLHGAGVVWGGSSLGREIYATTAGLRALEHGELVPFAPAVDAWIDENVLTCATALPDGRIAVGTLKGGALLVEADGSGAHQLELGAEFSTDTVNALFEDREGCLWIVCADGLFRVRPTRAVTVVPLPRAVAYPVQAIAPIADGALFASDTGIWRIGGPTAPDGRSFHQLDGFHERILGLVRDGDGVLVAHRGGVSRVSPDNSVALIRAAVSDVFTLARAADGRLYMALNRGVLELSPTGAREVPGTLPDIADSLVALVDGTLVAGTYASGVAVIGAPGARVAGLANALTEEPGRAFVAGSDQRLFAARGRKLAVLPAPNRPCLTLTLPAGSMAKALAGGTAGDAWLACNDQVPDRLGLPVIYHVQLDHDAVVVTPLRIDVLHQVGRVTSLAVQASSRGTVLWIGGESAALRVVPSELPGWTPPAEPELQIVTLLSAPAGELLLPYRRNRLGVNILSPEPDRRPSLRVQTLLDGTDATWSYPQDQNSVMLANLQNGHYRLQARFVAADGSVSPATSIHFSVSPPWWFTPWALLLQLAAAVSFMLGIVRLRLRSLRARADRLERLVAERTQQLARASEAKSAFVSSVSHELRNPLNGLVASAHALDDERLDPKQRRLLGTVRHCADLLDALIGDVLDMAEIESGTIKLRIRPYHPAEIVTAAASIMQPIAERKGLRLSFELAPNLPDTAYGDAFRVQQVLLNLAGNAVKYSEAGEIKLMLRRATQADEQLEYLVQDQGPGVTAAEKQTLFLKFSRLASSRAKGIPGTGLGLAVCRELVERMGGSIDVTNGLQAGSTFCFTVPIGTVADSEETPPSAAPFHLPRTALIVEDIDYNAEATVAILEVMGCQGDTAFTGAAALARLQERKYDVVFIDCDLPDMSGPDLARAIAAAGLESPPMLIAATAYADDATRLRCRESGMVGYIVKPVTRQKLRAVLTNQSEEPADNPGAQSTVDPGPNQTLDLRQLQLLGGERADIGAAGRRLCEMLESDVARLRQACDDGDYADARSIAHRITSHARFVGAKGLALVAREIERSATEEPELIAELIPSLESQAQQVVSTFQALKG